MAKTRILRTLIYAAALDSDCSFSMRKSLPIHNSFGSSLRSSDLGTPVSLSLFISVLLFGLSACRSDDRVSMTAVGAGSCQGRLSITRC